MKSFRLLIWPYIGWMTLFIVFPMLVILLYAITTTNSGQAVSLQFTLDNFIKFFDPVFLNVLWKSVRIASITTFFCLIFGYPLAYIISKKDPKVQTLLILLITIPMWINMLIRTYAWVGLLSDKGIINMLLGYVGIGPIKMLETEFAVILGMVYNFIPFMIIQIYTSLAKMDHSLVEASYDLGANRYQTFRKVIFPLSLSGVISGITLVFLPSLSTFVIPKLLGGGSFFLIGNLIENQFINIGDFHFGSAISLIMAVLILLSMQIAERYDRDKKEDGEGKVRGVKL